MTCLVGLIDGADVYIGADAVTAVGWELRPRKTPKVQRVGDFLIASAGASRGGNIVQFELPSADLSTKAASTDHDGLYRFMVVTFVPALRRVLLDAGRAIKKDEQESGGDTWLLIGYRGRLFVIDPSYYVSEPAQDYVAVGSGEEYALGSLHATHGAIRPSERVRMALEASATFHAMVRPPFTVECLKGNGR